MSSPHQKKININKVKNINYTEFTGHTINSYYMTTYFAYKYDNVHILDYTINYLKEDKNKNVIHSVYVKNIDIHAPHTGNENAECSANFLKCVSDQNIRYIIMIFRIHNIELPNHANCIIYDKNDKSFELFEPHGSTDRDPDINIRYAHIKDYLYGLFGDYDYFYLPIDYCPHMSFQRYAKKTNLKHFDTYGFCLAWTLWYIDTKLSNANINSNIDRKTLVSLLLESIDSNYFNDFIGNYSSFIAYISSAMKGCKNNICITENILFTIILQFFDLIDIDIIVFGHCSSNAKKYLKKIINNCGKPHLVSLCLAINCDHSLINYNNYSLRRALIAIIKNYDDVTCCQLYTQFISAFYDNKYNIFSYTDNSILCPYDTSILKKIRDNMIGPKYRDYSYDLLRRNVKCNNIYKLIVKGSVKDIVRQYGLLLLLLDYDKFNNYKKIHGLESDTYFHSINHLVYKFKDLPTIKDEVSTITNDIFLAAKNSRLMDSDGIVDKDVLIEELYKKTVNPNKQLTDLYRNIQKYKKVKNELNKVKDINYIQTNKINPYSLITYFTYKYDDVCFLDYSIDFKDNIIDGITKYDITFNNLNTTLPNIAVSQENFMSSFHRCLGNAQIKFIIILVYNRIGAETIANCIMYNKIGPSEIFNPYLTINTIPINAFSMSLESKLLELFPYSGYNYTYYYSNQFFQQLVEKNKVTSFEFGLSWTLWYLDTRLKYTNIDSDKLISILKKEININQFFTFINNYSSFISYISDSIQYCKTHTCDIDNMIFSLILQFFDLIDIDIIVFEHCNSNAKIYLIKMINNCGNLHLTHLCEMINYSPVHSTNYMLRKELRKIIKTYNDVKCCILYVNFISLFCDNIHNIFNYQDVSKLCPPDISILKKIRENMIDVDPQQLNLGVEFECADMFRIIKTGHIKDINRQYGLLLLLLNKYTFDSYKKAYGFESYNYFSAVKNLVNKFKNSSAINREVLKVTSNIILLEKYLKKNLTSS